MVLWYLVRWQRGYDELEQKDIDHIHYSGIYPVIGWFLHYLPFVAMARVTYVHHYYPALYFAVLAFGFLVDWMLRKRMKEVQFAIYGLLYSVVIGLYILFIPISWGMVGSSKQYRYLKWLDNWKITD
jgi:dolichyl-phosphate-mannose-protein mannosyltransferase